MAPGVPGTVFTVIVNDCAPLLPHPLLAATVKLPPVVPTVGINVVLLDVPDQPEGVFQM